MIVVGVDPGARETGIAIVDTRVAGQVLGSLTVTTPRRPHLVNVPPTYLTAVCAAVADALAQQGAELIAVEGITTPSPHAGITNPAAIMAAGVVLGAILGRSWGVPVVAVRPHGNGSRAWMTYPDELLTAADRRLADARGFAAAGGSAKRHERSAFDVARQGPQALALARQLGGTYAYAG